MKHFKFLFYYYVYFGFHLLQLLALSIFAAQKKIVK